MATSGRDEDTNLSDPNTDTGKDASDVDSCAGNEGAEFSDVNSGAEKDPSGADSHAGIESAELSEADVGVGKKCEESSEVTFHTGAENEGAESSDIDTGARKADTETSDADDREKLCEVHLSEPVVHGCSQCFRIFCSICLSEGSKNCPTGKNYAILLECTLLQSLTFQPISLKGNGLKNGMKIHPEY